MADNNELTDAQREFYATETGRDLPKGTTWDQLDSEQREILSDGYVPKAEEKTEESGTKDGSVETKEGGTSPKYTVLDAVNIANGKELYNLDPSELTALNDVLKDGVLEGSEEVQEAFLKVRKNIDDKLTYYANGEIDIPVEWAGDMQKMIDAGREELPKKEPYVEVQVTGMNEVTAQNWSHDKDILGKLDIKDLAQLRVEMEKNPEGFDRDAVNAAIFSKLEQISKMKSGEYLNKEDFASVQVLKESIPMSSRRESAGHDFEVFTSVESKLYSSRQHEASGLTVAMSGRDATAANLAENRLNAFLVDYDKQNGLDGITAEDGPLIEANMATMENMGKDSLDRNEYSEVPVKPMSTTEAETTLANMKSGKPIDMKTLASLASANAFGTVGPDEEFVAKVMADMVNQTLKSKNPISPDNLASFEVILSKVGMKSEKDMPAKTFQKAKGKLNKDRDEAKKNPTPKYKEMDDALALLDNVVVTDGFNMLGKKQSKEEAELKAQFVEAVRLQTQQKLVTTKPGPVTAEEFNKEFAANMVAEVVRLAGVQSAVEGNPKALNEMIKNKKIKISKDALLGYQASQSNAREGFASRLESKVGKNSGVDKMKANGKSLDDKLVKQNPKKYQTLKSLGKSAGWMGAYYVAGATMGPAGIALVATASLVNQANNLRKQYKQQKAEMAKKGKKLKLWSFLKQNKMAVASAALTAAGGIAAGLSEAAQLGAQISPDVISSIQAAKYHSGIALGVASTAKTFGEVRKSGGSIWKAMGASALSGAGTAWSVVSGQSHHDSSPEPVAEPTTLASVSHEPTPLGSNGFSAVHHDAEGNAWINDERQETRSPDPVVIQEQEQVAEVTPAPIHDQEPVYAVERTPELDAEFSRPLEAPMAQVDVPLPELDGEQMLGHMNEMMAENKVYGVVDPTSGKMVEFSLSEDGQLMTHNAEEIDLVGSSELHAAFADRVSQEVGHLSDSELAFLEKNMGAEKYTDVLLADITEKASDRYLVDGLEKLDERVETAEVQQDMKSSLNELVEAQYQSDLSGTSQNGLGSGVDSSENVVQTPGGSNDTRELTASEKIAAVRNGQTVNQVINNIESQPRTVQVDVKPLDHSFNPNTSQRA